MTCESPSHYKRPFLSDSAPGKCLHNWSLSFLMFSSIFASFEDAKANWISVTSGLCRRLKLNTPGISRNELNLQLRNSCMGVICGEQRWVLIGVVCLSMIHCNKHTSRGGVRLQEGRSRRCSDAGPSARNQYKQQSMACRNYASLFLRHPISTVA